MNANDNRLRTSLLSKHLVTWCLCRYDIADRLFYPSLLEKDVWQKAFLKPHVVANGNATSYVSWSHESRPIFSFFPCFIRLPMPRRPREFLNSPYLILDSVNQRLDPRGASIIRIYPGQRIRHICVQGQELGLSIVDDQV